MLALESKSNCHRILKLKLLGRLVESLKDPLLHIKAAEILRNLCIYSDSEWLHQLKGLTTGTSIVSVILTKIILLSYQHM